MSNRTGTASKIAEEEIKDLILKLQRLLPDPSLSSHSTVSATKVLKEACDYLKKLKREVDDLSKRLSQLMASGLITSNDMEIFTALLQE